MIPVAWVLVIGLHGTMNQALLGFPDLGQCQDGKAKFFKLMKAEPGTKPVADCFPADDPFLRRLK
jgi:hypothetical protein